MSVPSIKPAVSIACSITGIWVFLHAVQNTGENGFGKAVIFGIDHSRGDAVVIMMADESDDCRDVVRYWEQLGEGWDAVFGSRFMKGGGVIDYPKHKLLINRLANLFLRLLFGIPLNDFTNAFKGYRRTTLDACRPFLSARFNLIVELPLKAIQRDEEIPTSHLLNLELRDARAPIPPSNRRRGPGVATKYFSHGDYMKRQLPDGIARTFSALGCGAYRANDIGTQQVLYAGNQEPNTVSAYSVNGDGLLTAASASPSALGGNSLRRLAFQTSHD